MCLPYVSGLSLESSLRVPWFVRRQGSRKTPVYSDYGTERARRIFAVMVLAGICWHNATLKPPPLGTSLVPEQLPAACITRTG